MSRTPTDNDVMVQEWRDLIQRAHELLREGHPATARHQRLMQVLVLPSFRACAAYELCVSRAGEREQYSYACSTWDLESDRMRFASPLERLRYPVRNAPAIDRREAPADVNDARRLLAETKPLRIPVALDAPCLGTDGTSYEVAFGGSLREFRLRWWEDTPPEWEGAKRVADGLVALVQRAMGTSGDGG
jgi:hypothetical protein